MRRNIIDNVEIKEPPIEELSRRRSGWKRSCFTGCGCIVFFIIIIAVLIRISMGPGPQTLKQVPENFPKDIPVYDTDNIESITYISGKYKNRGIEIAAFFPKIILSPIFLATDKKEKQDTPTLKRMWQIISTPVGDYRDIVQIEWTDLDADQSFVVAYYKKELQKKDYKIDIESEGQNIQQFTFSKGEITGSFYTENSPDIKKGTGHATMTINLPAEN